MQVRDYHMVLQVCLPSWPSHFSWLTSAQQQPFKHGWIFQSECYLFSFLPVFYSTLIIWWTNERANLLEARDQQLEEEAADEGGKFKRTLSKLVDQDYLTPSVVDMVVRHSSPILISIMLTHQLTGMPSNNQFGFLSAEASLQLPCWLSIVVLNFVTCVMIARFYLRGKRMFSHVNDLTGSLRVRLVNSHRYPGSNLNIRALLTPTLQSLVDPKNATTSDSSTLEPSVEQSISLPTVPVEPGVGTLAESSPSASVRSSPKAFVERV